MDMPEQQFPPVPTSPASVPGVSDTVAQTDMSQDEMISHLKELMSKIQAKYGDFNSSKAIGDSKMMQSKSQSLREVFDLLQSVGIDPSNVEQVQGFLDKIKESNPQLYQQIEKVLQDIMGGDITDPGTEVETGEVPQDLETAAPVPDPNMNINNTNETPQETI